MQDESKNLILATALSFLVILVWFVLFPPQDPVQPTPSSELTAPTSEELGLPPGAAAGPATQPSALQTRTDALEEAPRVRIETPRLTGSISLAGGRIDDLHLVDYFETLAKEETVTLLSPAGAPNAYYALHGWAPTADLSFDEVPNPNTPWELEVGQTLTPSTPVTLRWDNGAGLIFRKTISVDDNYMFDITQSIENTTQNSVRLAPYGIIARHGEPETVGFYVLHEGVVRAQDGEINEVDYNDMPDLEFNQAERGNLEKIDVTTNGWIGFTDKYWMTTLIPETGQNFTSVTKYTPGSDTYQTETRLPTREVAPGASIEHKTSLFAGAKEEKTIQAYEESRSIERFVDSIDWGWFWFLTKPFHWALVFFYDVIGNMGWAIISLTLVIKIVLFPLAYKSFVSMSKMKALQPQMEELKEKAGDDKEKLQKGMMELYKKEKVNPASGCLPILVQIPIFFALYKVLFVAIEVRHEPFIGWIKDLSAPDPTSILNLFGLLPFATPGPESLFAIFSIGVWPVLMGLTMWLQQKLNPAPTDPTQAAVFAWLPFIFMFMLGTFASGLVIYWVANNTITFIQQYVIMRSQGVEIDLLGNITGKTRKKPEPSKPAK
ncbi:MAG: membrane protein insertase YidC [Pseudomonadota bacterium]